MFSTTRAQPKPVTERPKSRRQNKPKQVDAHGFFVLKFKRNSSLDRNRAIKNGRDFGDFTIRFRL